MDSKKFLVYQPNHGIGVELAMVHHAARLARILDRTVVLPLLPILERQVYQGGVERYFELPVSLAWISTIEFAEQYQGEIDRLFSLEPQWQPEYRSELVRERHPVWLDNILRHPYFALAGMRVRETTRMTICSPLAPGEAREMFSTPDTTIGFSYLHSLVEGNSTYEEPDRDQWWRRDVPTQPRREFLQAVELMLGARPSLALHIRRGSLDNARVIDGVDLPGLDAFAAQVPGTGGLIYVATDEAAALEAIRIQRPDARQIASGHATRDAVIDLSACVLADQFVGTYYSTFSQYIFHARTSLGQSRSSTLLL